MEDTGAKACFKTELESLSLENVTFFVSKLLDLEDPEQYTDIILAAMAKSYEHYIAVIEAIPSDKFNYITSLKAFITQILLTMEKSHEHCIAVIQAIPTEQFDTLITALKTADQLDAFQAKIQNAMTASPEHCIIVIEDILTDKFNAIVAVMQAAGKLSEFTQRIQDAMTNSPGHCGAVIEALQTAGNLETFKTQIDSVLTGRTDLFAPICRAIAPEHFCQFKEQIKTIIKKYPTTQFDLMAFPNASFQCRSDIPAEIIISELQGASGQSALDKEI